MNGTDDKGGLLREIYAHCDLEERLALLPKNARVRGLYLNNTRSVLRAAGKLDSYQRYVPDGHSAVQ